VRKVLFLVVPILLYSCAPPRVVTVTGRKANFENYYTYRIEHPDIPQESDEEKQSGAKVLFDKVQRVIRIQMDSRGYEMTQIADLVIEYKLIIENKVDYQINESYRYANPYSYYSYPHNNYNKREYTEGTLIVGIREDYGNALVWEASLNLKYNKRSGKKKHDPIENAFDLIFSEYLYTAGNPNPSGLDDQEI